MENDGKSEINLKLRSLREANELSQDDFAKKVGIKFRTYQNYEMGLNDPSYGNLCKICSALNVPFSYFDPSNTSDKNDRLLLIQKTSSLNESNYHSILLIIDCFVKDQEKK